MEGRRGEDTRTGGGGQVTMEMGIREVYLLAKECQGWAAAPEAKRKAWELILPWSFQSQHGPANTWILDFQPSEL